MATATTKRAPRARKPQTRRPRVAPKVAPKVEATVEVRTKVSPRQPQLDPRTIAFAYVGAGELAVSTVRSFSDKVVEFVRTPRDMQSMGDKLSTDMTKVVEDLAARGEKVVDSLRKSAYTKRAFDQSKIARSQVKAARTSVRKAVDSATEAAREAVKKVS